MLKDNVAPLLNVQNPHGAGDWKEFSTLIPQKKAKLAVKFVNNACIYDVE